MAATVWKGHLTFGLVSIPVRWSGAARRERISFHQLHRREPPPQWSDVTRPPGAGSTSAPPPETDEPAPVERVRQGLFTREDQVPIPRNEIVKGYEFEK